VKLYGSRRWGGAGWLLALGWGAWAPQVLALDAQSCQALREQGGKFALGLEACGPQQRAAVASPAAPRLLPRAAQAQQLHLFDSSRAAELAASQAAHSAGSPTPRTRSGQRATPASAPATAPKRLPQSLTRAIQLAPAVERVAADHAIDPLLLHAIARVESRHNVQAISPAGARGLMQVMPATGARFGVGHAAALHDATTSLEVSARYLRVLHTRFQGQLPLVLAAYNAGEGAVERYGRRIPPFAETQGYVRQVLTEYQRLQAASEATAE
jgi:soluble lytic murein transglycosylase-like protein